MRPPWLEYFITAPGKRPARNPKVEGTMEYQVGDKVVHWTYGLGEIVQLDEKMISGQTAACYVVQVGELTIWVPQKIAGHSSLRPPTPDREFKKTVSILRSPGEPLSAASQIGGNSFCGEIIRVQGKDLATGKYLVFRLKIQDSPHSHSFPDLVS